MSGVLWAMNGKQSSSKPPPIKTDQHDVQAMRNLAGQMLALKLRLLAKPEPPKVLERRGLRADCFPSGFGMSLIARATLRRGSKTVFAIQG